MGSKSLGTCLGAKAWARSVVLEWTSDWMLQTVGQCAGCLQWFTIEAYRDYKVPYHVVVQSTVVDHAPWLEDLEQCERNWQRWVVMMEVV